MQESGEENVQSEEVDDQEKEIRLYVGCIPEDITRKLFLTRFRPFPDIKVAPTCPSCSHFFDNMHVQLHPCWPANSLQMSPHVLQST